MRAKRVDENQSALVKQIRQIPNVSVFHTHELGKGFPDVVLGFRNVNYLVEIKNPNQPKSKRALTPDEEVFHAGWNGTVHIVETIEDILKILEIYS